MRILPRKQHISTVTKATLLVAVVLALIFAFGHTRISHSQPGLCGGSIQVGETVSNEIGWPDQVCPYTFSGSAGDTVTVRMNRTTSSLDPWLDLLDPDGSLVASDDDGGGDRNSRIEYELPSTGTYTIVARSYENGSAGGFELLMSGEGGSSCGGSIQGGEVSGEIGSPGQVCPYIFFGSAGDTVTVRMNRTTSSLDPWLDLLDPDGSLVASDDDGGGDRNSRIEYALPNAGTYTIVARSYENGSAGGFELSMSGGGGSSCGGSIQFGETVSNEIGSPGQECRYTFFGSAGDTVTVRMDRTTSSLDPWLDLLDPDGNWITSDDDGGGVRNSRIEYALPNPGTYTIVARSYQNSSVGSFTLSMSD